MPWHTGLQIHYVIADPTAGEQHIYDKSADIKNMSLGLVVLEKLFSRTRSPMLQSDAIMSADMKV